MMRIAVVTGHFPCQERPTDGRPAYHTLRELARRAEVRVFHPNPTYPSLLRFHSASRGDRNMAFNPPSDLDVNYYHYPALPVISRPCNGWIAARVLLPHVRSFAPDVILSYFLYPDAFAALQIGKALSVPVVAGGVGSDVHSIGHSISAMHTRTVLREADFLFTVSRDLCDRAVAMGASPKKARPIISGCDWSVFHVRDHREARERLHINKDSKTVVYVGRMDLKKGLRELVEAAVLLRPQRPDLQVYLVGEGPDRPIVQKLIDCNKATRYVQTLAPCTFDEVATWMAAADVFTLPSYMEGCPNVVLEALACGRPVVATNVGGIPEIMEDGCGQLIPPRDAHALARALASVLDRAWNAEVISAKCSRSWSDVASELLEIFEMLVSTRQEHLDARQSVVPT
jgi:teichuronic acid biosynthesis glycosyltransferase TuaC